MEDDLLVWDVLCLVEDGVDDLEEDEGFDVDCNFDVDEVDEDDEVGDDVTDGLKGCLCDVETRTDTINGLSKADTGPTVSAEMEPEEDTDNVDFEDGGDNGFMKLARDREYLDSEPSK